MTYVLSWGETKLNSKLSVKFLNPAHLHINKSLVSQPKWKDYHSPFGDFIKSCVNSSEILQNSYICTGGTYAAITKYVNLFSGRKKGNANKSAERWDLWTTFHPIFLWSVSPQLTRNDCHKWDNSLRNHRTQWHSIKYILKIKTWVKGTQLWLMGQHATGWL